METKLEKHYIAFADSKKIASGNLLEVALKAKKNIKSESKVTLLIFDSLTSQQIDVDLRGTPENITRRLEAFSQPAPVEENKKTGPGRPKLGVTSKEVTLLPAHWEWLTSQPGGASVTLRRLVDEAKKKNLSKDLVRQAQESTYKFMTIMAGDRTNYEEALRALYATDKKKFEKMIADWPKDIKEHLSEISERCFQK